MVKAAERPRGETHSGNSIGQLPWSVWHCPVRSRNATCSSASLPPVAAVSLCRSGSFRPVVGCYRSNKPRQEFPPVSTFEPPSLFRIFLRGPSFFLLLRTSLFTPCSPSLTFSSLSLFFPFLRRKKFQTLARWSAKV